MIRGREAVADAIELMAATTGKSANSEAYLRDCAMRFGASSEDVDLALQAMARRQQTLADAYPFKVGGSGVRFIQTERSTYLALLLLTTGLSVFPLQEHHVAAAALCLEDVVADCMANFFGEGTRALRFGHPSDVGRPPSFPAAVKWLAAEMGVQTGDVYRDPRRQDGGLDVIAWRPFADKRPGFPIVLIQVTLEQNFAHKAADLNTRLWGLLLGLDVDPMAALAVPRTVSQMDLWREVSTRCVILDRIRLSGLQPAAASLDKSKHHSLLSAIADGHRGLLSGYGIDT